MLQRLLDGYGAKYAAYELNQESDGEDLQKALLAITGQRTVPNVFINKQHIGGDSDFQAVVKSGKDGKNGKVVSKTVAALSGGAGKTKAAMKDLGAKRASKIGSNRDIYAEARAHFVECFSAPAGTTRPTCAMS